MRSIVITVIDNSENFAVLQHWQSQGYRIKAIDWRTGIYRATKTI